jgi:hypothetical protein
MPINYFWFLIVTNKLAIIFEKIMTNDKLNKIIKVLIITLLAMIALYPIAVIMLGIILYLNA